MNDFPHCKHPCAECPWRLANPAGKFPPHRYRVLISTAVDMAIPVFGCHMSTEEHTVACAGFLLSLDAQHNLSVRMSRLDLATISTDVPLHASYYRLARFNGVRAADLTALREDCR